MAKKASQLDREITEALGSRPSGYVMAADRLGQRPSTLPKLLRHGGYTATFKGIEERFPGDSLASAQWDITRRGKVVGHLYDGRSYGWGRPHSSMNPLVWGGKMPEGSSDPRSPNYGILFDQGPADSYAEALANFARAADRLIAWRHQHGFAAMGHTREGKVKRTAKVAGGGRRAHSTIAREDEELVPTAEARRQVQTIARRDEFPQILAISLRVDGVNYQLKVPDAKNSRGYDLVNVLVHPGGLRSIKSTNRSRTTPHVASSIVTKYLAAVAGK